MHKIKKKNYEKWRKEKKFGRSIEK